MRIKHFIILVMLPISLSSCATLFTGVRQNVNIASNPPGAQIYIDGVNQGVTPSTIRIKKDFDLVTDNGKDIRLLMEGYEDDYFLETTVNPVAILNLTNILFWGIDLITGAVMRFEKHYLFEMKLDQEQTTAPTPPKIGNAPAEQSDKYDRLRKLKELYDEGVIDQQEFEAEKAKVLAE